MNTGDVETKRKAFKILRIQQNCLISFEDK